MFYLTKYHKPTKDKFQHQHIFHPAQQKMLFDVLIQIKVRKLIVLSKLAKTHVTKRYRLKFGRLIAFAVGYLFRENQALKRSTVRR